MVDSFRLPNGIQVLFQYADTPISHACVMIRAGSRNEGPSQFGLVHFIEHLLFKQTERRNASQIIHRLESVGADVNAYTTKEYTCLHASFLTPYLRRTLDLFEDILFHSVFPEEEIEKERGVVIDEIAAYRDSPDEALMDDFEDLVFSSHPLGHNILGIEHDVLSFDRNVISGFTEQHFVTSNIVVGITGRYSQQQVRRQMEAIFGHVDRKNCSYSESDALAVAGGSSASFVEIRRPLHQVHHVLGAKAYPEEHSKKVSLMLLNNILGGFGMSSRLNMTIREQHGLAYTIESSYTPFFDTGLFSVYFAADQDNYFRARELVLREFRKLREKALSTAALQQAKKKFMGQIALAEENRMGLLLSQSRALIYHQEPETLEVLYGKIEAVTSAGLLDVANEILDEKGLFAMSLLPE